ncbi:lantibiotic dehydratase C-terminal domain-containing protein [Streptantibioticus silvisoli]|uniref:Lantibiotic dehydratase C-terminal domain-containing protein n=1 Tax=Streptantibioticus silvisoli TaxID=2705255 RepID=A0ABT6VVH0_9ACTN|nr:lantibiotic dehydratase C-terminal domain-containing protein [Streptantibioticus silvisoli]MDI5961757.1 lantibiotic dehydratase C-terminal domain-containing protein [Streptantibioticus silvisoli]
MSSATAPAGATEGAWQAIHVWYAASPRPLLLECVKPLVDELTADGLLAGHFFINYWLEGPHLRLRLKPAGAGAAEEVRRRAEEAVTAFLKRRPALYEVKNTYFADLYNALFDLEFPGEERSRLMGPDGKMRLRPNNSHSFEPYEPEYGKYGGPAGVALAEWHFQHSSDLVVEALRTMNLHLRTVLLGTSAQLMMVMSACFLTDDEELTVFLERYHAFWDGAFAGTEFTARQGYDRAYEQMGAELGRRFGEIRAALAAGEDARLPAFLRGWAGHCRELVARVKELAQAGALEFRTWSGDERMVVDDVARALPMLVSPYMHMTNNRLSVTVRDEAFLAYVLARSLREAAAVPAEPR